MVHNGNAFALNQRDKIVGRAVHGDPAVIANRQGHHLRAALLDCAENLLIGSVPKAITGFAVVLPYPLVAYQGWVGGIVSVRKDHTSRFDNVRSAAYLIATLILQLVPYSLTVGAGVNVGIACYRPAPYYQGEKWLSILPKESIKDLGRIYALSVLLFLLASLWEFLSPWTI